ncbi:LysR family transcriptional regulator [Ktedonosporobacter rubrisoli]|uniref:LysR family transcriptional regulator n=1 Tax=Ktedonosporobacter rubrisoli TaxID=2509675 RepID=A0A4P6JK71_KTERU|nr:LysR family transcriptional regulator [Ktedonosporobacter rubrisoli]QBD75548.1 LysR family transcriptional regulator [Ktedonosporobacter rubrisoli]
MELRQLHYFLVVAEELHFSRAAARLHMSQPPLSQQIKQLEEELGVQLFKRTKRHVELTEAGEVFLQGTRQILAQVKHTINDTQRAERGEVGSLTIGFVGSATYEILPKILRAYRASFPDVKLDLRQLTTAEQVKALIAGQIQLGFLRPPIQKETLRLETLLREPLVVALPKDHQLAAETHLSLRSLAQEPWILYPRRLGAGTYDRLMRACQQAGFEPQIVQEAIEMQTIVGLVATGIGISLVPASVQGLRQNDIIYRDLFDPPLSWELALAMRREEPSPVLENFLTIARSFRQED